MTYDNKSSAELEREIEEQRNRVEARLGEIKERLSPGQLLDEALSYTKHGGAHFASNLGQQVTANPMPAALVGIGLAWLISSNVNGNQQHASYHREPADSPEYPYANIGMGGLRRVSHAADESGLWWSEFETASGGRYKARSDEHGNRLGHFTDNAGKMFAGFIDETGGRVSDFRDEAGNMLQGARSWASHNWQDMQSAVGEGLHAVGSAARQAASGLKSGTRHLSSGMQHQGDALGRQITQLFEQQPLIAGALAFAAGAALGATLPHTEQEDRIVGKQADRLRGEAGKMAADLYERGKEQAADLYEDVSAKAGDLYDEARDRMGAIAGGTSSHSRH